ncbi:MAG: ABC transporter permease [Acidimicrobiales bacterium]
MRAIAIARASIRRVTRDRTSLFFLIVLPVIVIVIVGATARGFTTFKVGVDAVGADAQGRELVSALEHTSGIDVVSYTSEKSLTLGLARGEVSTGVLIPRDLGAAERSGRTIGVTVFAERVNNTQQAAATAVSSVILRQGALVEAARFTAAHSASSYDVALGAATRLQASVPRVTVRTVSADTTASTLPQGYAYSAPTELVLFVFLSALAGGGTIIDTRRLGMYERMLAAPLRARTIVLGETLTYFCIALAQSLLIVVVGSVAFGVSWGDPLAAIALVLLWALVGAGAGLLAGTLFRTPEQAGSIGTTAGLALAMLGGCMWPLSIVSTVMREVGHVAPQAWAVDAWTALLARHGTIVTILPQLGVLAGFAAVLLAVSTSRLTRQLR